MAIYTDFFIATEEELLAAFPLRYPSAKRPKARKGKNPLTGKAVTVMEWGPAKPFPPTPDEVTYPNRDEWEAVAHLPLVQMKSVDPYTLSLLWEILGGGDSDALLDDILRPALVAPEAYSSMLYRLPQAFIEAVAGIEKVAPVVKAWVATEELKFDKWKVADARAVIEQLQELAKRAIAESKGMFLWMNV